MTIPRLISLGALFSMLTSSAVAGEVRFTAQGHAFNPTWSMDGRYLAFEVNNYDDKSDLYISMVNGAIANDGQKVTLPGGGGPFGGSQVVQNPVWHPQGTVVFEGSNTGGQYRLYYYQPGTGAASEMITSAEVPGEVTFPAIDKKGEWLAFVADHTGHGDITLRETSTAKITSVMKSDAAEMFPQFDAAGSKILFTRKHKNSEDVFEVTLATGAETPVVGGPNDQTRPTYAAGGRVLFFDNSRDSQQWDLAAVSGPGGSKKILAKHVRLPLRARPATTPDGNWVAVAYEDPMLAGMIAIIKVDGSNTVKVKTPYGACGEPSIGVQGATTLLAYTAIPEKVADYRKLYVEDITGKL